MVQPQQHSIHEHLKEASSFIGNYAAILYASGATTIRIEKNILRMAGEWRMHAEFSILPTDIIISLWNENKEHSYSTIVRIPEGAINYRTVTYLSRLSRRTAQKHLSIDDARCIMQRITGFKRLDSRAVLFLVGAANASFCRLFGGDPVSMAIVFVATVSGFFIKQRLTEKKWDYRMVSLVSACLAAILSSSGFVFGWGETPETALATSVLFLVPGIPFSNAVSDLIHGRYICSLSRFCQAMMITVSLSLGLCLAFLILNIKFY